MKKAASKKDKPSLQINDFQSVGISAEAQKEIKGGEDIIITDVVQL